MDNVRVIAELYMPDKLRKQMAKKKPTTKKAVKATPKKKDD